MVAFTNNPDAKELDVIVYQKAQKITKFPLIILLVKTKGKCHIHRHSQNRGKSSGMGEHHRQCLSQIPCTSRRRPYILGFKVLYSLWFFFFFSFFEVMRFFESNWFCFGFTVNDGQLSNLLSYKNTVRFGCYVCIVTFYALKTLLF